MKSASRKDSISEQGFRDPNVWNTSTEHRRRPEHSRSRVRRTSTTQPWKPWKCRWTQRPRCGRPYCADRSRILPSTIVPDSPVSAAVVAVVGTGPLQSASNFSLRQYSPISVQPCTPYPNVTRFSIYSILSYSYKIPCSEI